MGGGAKIANTAGVTFYDHNLLDLTFDTKLGFRTKLSKHDVKICGRCEMLGWMVFKIYENVINLEFTLDGPIINILVGQCILISFQQNC